ncbi:hypothetical protein [Streptomyces sp. MST-110588]|uniref:WXG100 family type VII secretion target n=1 Tax=Streptomyces sp. MST-110588 TaxID=2833628 RepID=UPI001F5DCBF1|nr:hypothetical protein [Streptomyces sp. MST-110588]UNO43278.1 hypothetical protein KGS77_32070 [Streptomyces sp. MST-110588]
MGITVQQLEQADPDLVRKAAEAWEEQVRKLKDLVERYRTEVKDPVEKSGWQGPAYEAARSNWVEELTQLENAQAEADGIRLALEMATADIRAAQSVLSGGVRKARENGASVTPDGGLELPPAMVHDPDVRSGPVGENLRQAHAQIQDALRMADQADERIAWDLLDDGGARGDAFNGRVHMGRRLSPGEILRTFQVTDDPRGMTDFYGERVTQGEADMLSDLSIFEKSDFKEIRDRAFEECKVRFPEDRNDGHMDAFRHAYWNALMAQRFGMDWAERYGTAHERLPGNPSDREAMDLHNNEIGRRIALNNPTASPAELAAKVQEAVQGGKTVVIDRDGKLVPSDKVEIGRHGHTNKVPGAPDEGRNPDAPGPDTP